jgi:asparagine synthase (glutamine-hydrolysing)
VCGIIGQVRRDGRAVSRATLEAMCAALEHRGPDSRGLHVEGQVGLGIQRLRVIDLETGDQPIYNEDGSVVVVLNGEIYNFRELRHDLLRRGHRFSTEGDTEVIVHLYEEMGPRCVESLHGMFGLAVWDQGERRLLLARDRVGKKPLYYADRPEALSFASELTALMEDPEIARDPDPAALDAYLAYRWVPAPASAFAAARKLPAATYLVLDESGVRTERYWRLDFSAKRRFGSAAERNEEIRGQIRRAVGRRMIADVPLGAFLSGGVDSSTVVAAMAEQSSEPVRTFSIGFTHDEYNELPQARLVAERFGTEHHEYVVEPDAVEILPRIVRHYGEPFADPSAVPSFYVAEMARREVTVALNGDGGDETFAGYGRYAANVLLARADRVPGAARRLLQRAVALLPASGRIESPINRLRRGMSVLGLDAPDRYAAYMTQLNGLDRAQLYTPEYRRTLSEAAVLEVIRRPWRESTATDIVDRMLDVDTVTYLTDDLLAKMDIATMAHSLEGRSPLLDYEFMEFAASLPPTDKLSGQSYKVGLKEAARGWVPDEILDAPKRGFRLPIHDWLRGDLRDYARDVLLDPAAIQRGHFNRAYVERLLSEHADSQADHSQGIWTLLMYELWHDHVRGGSARDLTRTS